MTLSEELTWRGLINQTTLDDVKKLDDKTWTFYHGFDASADSQAIGNLAAMMVDRVFLKHGSKGILLAGGGTSLIGDPGGKDVERPLQSKETIAHNTEAARKQLEIILAGYEFTTLNNIDWLEKLTVVDFLRDIGKHFGMSTLVQRDYIQKRIGKGGDGMSYTEFSYTLLQGYDFLHLNQEYNCDLQLSGADQWGNCLSGVDLIRKVNGSSVHALTMPLIINKATGKKFGKSEEGAVWLDESKTSVYQFYQFWLNTDDDAVEDYLKIYTLIEPAELEALLVEFRANPSDRQAQKYLAFEVTKLVHGEKRALSVQNVSEVLFGSRQFSELSQDDIVELSKEIPVVESTGLVELLVTAGLASSNSEANRFIQSGAISVNQKKIESVEQFETLDDVGSHLLLKRGKNGFALIKR